MIEQRGTTDAIGTLRLLAKRVIEYRLTTDAIDTLKLNRESD